MQVIADLHLHSRFSRAVSPQMSVVNIAGWAKKKGIGLVGTADWTHPIWFRELQANLEEVNDGIYRLKTGDNPLFLLSTELSCIYSQGGRVRRIHLLVFVPGLASAEKISKGLLAKRFNLGSDGRPILGISARDLTEVILNLDERALIIPAHAWTPHFSVFGQVSGFDSLQECFGDLSKYIYAIETGLSSDPAMNWRIAELENRSIVSFSDAHSGAKLGREATVLDLPEVSFKNISKALINQASSQTKISHTIEFYPEEGKYHYTGHRNCKIVYSSNEARKKGMVCPVCGRTLTVGVMSRVEELAKIQVEIKTNKDNFGVIWLNEKNGRRPPYTMTVPLSEIIAESLGTSVASKKVVAIYEQLVDSLGGEFKVLLETEVEEIKNLVGEKIALAVKKVRSGDIFIEPGYDGVFGKVKIWKEKNSQVEEEKTLQETLF